MFSATWMPRTAQAIERAQDAEIAIHIEGAFEIQYGGDLSGATNPFDIARVERQLDFVTISPNLVECRVNH